MVIEMKIFFSGSKSATDMALRLVHIQNRASLSCQCRVDLYQSVRYIFVYSGFADAKSFGSLAYSGIMVDDIVSNGDRSFLNIILQEVTPQNTFLHCMKYSGGL